MAYLPRSVDQIIEWSERQITNPSQNWSGLCQSHVRQAMGIGAWAPSAIEAWGMIPAGKKHATSDPSKAERGSAIYYSGGQYGHVVIAIGKSTNDKCLSNDYVRQGWIDKAPRTFPRWGLECVGWSFWTPAGEVEPDQNQLWDGQVPSIEGCFNAQNDARLANPQSHRLADRLFDLGFYSGTPQADGVQKFPAKAVANFQSAKGMKVNPAGAYSPEVHSLIFP